MTQLPAALPQHKLVQMGRWLLQPTELLEECTKRLGETFTIHLPGYPPSILFTNPEAIKQIFTGDPDIFYAGQANSVLRFLLGDNSLLLLDGQRHLKERKLLMPPFHGERMKAYAQEMRSAVSSSLASWPRGVAFPVHHKMQEITLEVITRTVFGVEEGERAQRLRALLTDLLDRSAHPWMLLILLVLQPDQVEKVLRADPSFSVGPLRLPLGKLLPWTKLTKLAQQVDALLFEQIAQRRAEGTANRTDILSMLIEAKDENGQGMTQQELRDEMMTLLVAGHETTATALSWTIGELLQNQSTLIKLQEELDAMLGDAPASFEKLQELPYLDAVIKESLRLHPIAPLVGRVLQKPAQIGGIALPAGVSVIPALYLTHRRPDLYEDPDRFWPERFVGKKPTPYEFYPFGGGVRRCLGMAFAMFELKLVLAEVLRKVHFQAKPGYRMKLIRRGVTFAPSEGVPVLAYDRHRPKASAVAQ